MTTDMIIGAFEKILRGCPGGRLLIECDPQGGYVARVLVPGGGPAGVSTGSLREALRRALQHLPFTATLAHDHEWVEITSVLDAAEGHTRRKCLRCGQEQLGEMPLPVPTPKQCPVLVASKRGDRPDALRQLGGCLLNAALENE